MESNEIKENIKKFWKWLWESESILSYVVFLVIIFIVIKFIFLPGLGLIFGTPLPLAIVESSSMEHHALGHYNEICGKNLQNKGFLSLDEYWETCGPWYSTNTNITKEQFQDFNFKDGFRKGDLMIIFGKSINKIKIGDILVFRREKGNPIIHRVISTSPLATKGDHNPGQLSEEKNIFENQIIGVAVARIPYVGWIKLIFVEIWNSLKR